MAVVHITALHVELHVEHIFKLKAIFEPTLRSTVNQEHSIYRITKKSNLKNIMPVSFANSALRDCTVLYKERKKISLKKHVKLSEAMYCLMEEKLTLPLIA